MSRAPAEDGPRTDESPPAPLRRADPAVPDPPVPESSLAELLSRVEHLVSRRMEQALSPNGLPLDQWRVLHLLAERAERGAAMSGIAASIGVPAPTLTKIVDRLVESALVHRRIDETDRRRVLVFLSAHGREVHDRLAAAVADADADLAAHLCEVDAGLLSALLARLLHRLG